MDIFYRSNDRRLRFDHKFQFSELVLHIKKKENERRQKEIGKARWKTRANIIIARDYWRDIKLGIYYRFLKIKNI